MDTDKKKIIAGAGLLGASALAYILSRKGPPSPPPPPPQTYKCPYCGETFGTLTDLQAHIQSAHPDEPPVQFGYVTGYVTNKSGTKIVGASVTINNDLDCHSDANGAYRTNNYAYGSILAMVVQADNYQTSVQELTVNATVATLNIELTPVEMGPDWIAAVSVQKVTVTPAVVYPGQEVEIKIDISYTCGAPRPQNTPGKVHIDGVTLSGDFVLEYYNPTFYFHYTPQFPGVYTVTSGSSSAALTVLKEDVANYYSPFGGVRWPLVTDLVFPDVAPFTIEGGGWEDIPLKEYPWVFPGGDLKLSDIVERAYPGYWADPWLGAHTQYFSGPYANISYFTFPPPFGFLSNYVGVARVAATDTPGCPMDKYGIIAKTFQTYTSSCPGVIAMITDKQGCPDYWDSKEALAQMIGRYNPMGSVHPVYPPSQLVTPYHVICNYCGGTGSIQSAIGYIECPFCLGIAYGAPGYAGKLWPFDIYKGIRDWTWPPFVFGDPDSTRAHHHYSIYCPYCQTPFSTGDLYETAWYEPERIAWARQFIAHIEQSHPNHPLTEPAWF